MNSAIILLTLFLKNPLDGCVHIFTRSVYYPPRPFVFSKTMLKIISRIISRIIILLSELFYHFVDSYINKKYLMVIKLNADRHSYCCYNNRNIRKRCERFSKLTIKTPYWRHWNHSVAFIVNFEHISDLFLVFLLLN